VIYLNIVRSFHLIMDIMDRVHKNDYFLEEEENEDLPDLPSLSADHLKIRRRLLPLLQVEHSLMSQLCPSSPISEKHEKRTPKSLTKHHFKEIAVNSATQWKGCFECSVSGDCTATEGHTNLDDPSDPGRLLRACCEDMVRLWTDPIIRELLRKMKFRMEDHAGLYEVIFSNSLNRSLLDSVVSLIPLSESQHRNIFPPTVSS
jgi:guanine nucleotide-binding protein subunit alpha